ncbi:MAG: acyl carrier protein [Firmicutes bacterium]|nr:acyl carrier protein [Bacillota bacterium]MBQ6810569.1 acyl carrier protein [Bacillota bacterium]
MTEQEVFAILCEMASAYGFRSRKPIGAKTRFKRDLKMDAVDFLDLVLKVEKRFGCRLEDELLAQVVNLGQLALVLEKALAEQDEKRNKDERIL